MDGYVPRGQKGSPGSGIHAGGSSPGDAESLRALGLAASRPLSSLQETGQELQGAKEGCCSDRVRVREREVDRETAQGTVQAHADTEEAPSCQDCCPWRFLHRSVKYDMCTYKCVEPPCSV